MSDTMRDIIDVPVVETVVRLQDAEDSRRQKGMVHSFVLTGQVKNNLEAIASSIRDKKGSGYFLLGTYGSGKSHFLSYLSLVASGTVVSETASPVSTALSGRRLLPVTVSLINFRGDRPLEKTILAAAERSLNSLGSTVKLTRRTRFVEFIDNTVRKTDSDRMDKYLRTHGFEEWNRLKNDLDKAATAAWAYLKTLPDHPEIPDITPDRLITMFLNEAKRLEYDGVLIVIDELSEFLRSKPSPSTLTGDARYLQLLGEMAKSEPLWIVASLQEAIEQTGDIARDVIRKIKDRYPVRLILDENHVRQLIDGRLINKRDGAREKIRCIGSVFQRHFRVSTVTLNRSTGSILSIRIPSDI